MILTFSQLFKDKLNRINSDIARKILELENQESENLDINYLSISMSNPIFISYLDNSRIERITKQNVPRRVFDSITFQFVPKGFPHLYEVDSDIPENYHEKYSSHFFNFNSDQIFSEENVFLDGYEFIEDLILQKADTFTFRTYDLFGCSVYITTQKAFKYLDYTIDTKMLCPALNELLYDPNKRYHSSAGKAIRRVLNAFGESFTDKQIDEFVGLYKLESFKECGDLGDLLYEELKGEDIRWAYHENHYYGCGGTLHGSCMRYSNCQEYLDIYVENPDKISLAVLKKEGLIAARSLVWNHGDDVLFDRIYYIDETTRIALQAKLESLGYKNVYDGDYKNVSYFINLAQTDFRYYPYMDTFQYLVLGSGLGNYGSCSYDYELTNAEGGPMHEGSECDCCGDRVDSDDIHYIDRGRSRGESLCNDCCTWLESDEYVHNDDAQYCRYVTGYYYADDCVELYDGEYALVDDCTEDVDGNWYLYDEIEKDCIEFRGRWYNKEDHDDIVYVNELGEYYHVDSDEYQNYLEDKELKENEEAQEENKIKENEITQTTIKTEESNAFLL